jgi:hypothetical protein
MSELSRQLIKVWEKSAPTVTTTSSVILDKNERRKYALITNNSNTTIWLWFYSPAVVNEGIMLLDTGWSYEIDHKNLWVGDVYAIHGSTGSKALSVLEGY